MVVEISLTKNLERQKKEQIQGKTIRRMPICNPTIQLVVVNLYPKHEVSILNGCGDIFDEKALRNYGRTDGRTDGTTDRCKPVYPPPPTFSKRGYKKCYGITEGRTDGMTDRCKPVYPHFFKAGV